jgi:hypothetical protein
MADFSTGQIAKLADLHWHPQEPGWLHCGGGEKGEEELLRFDKPKDHDGEALRDAGAKLSVTFPAREAGLHLATL